MRRGVIASRGQLAASIQPRLSDRKLLNLTSSFFARCLNALNHFEHSYSSSIFDELLAVNPCCPPALSSLDPKSHPQWRPLVTGRAAGLSPSSCWVVLLWGVTAPSAPGLRTAFLTR